MNKIEVLFKNMEDGSTDVTIEGELTGSEIGDLLLSLTYLLNKEGMEFEKIRSLYEEIVNLVEEYGLEEHQ